MINSENDDLKFMTFALEEAKKAEAQEEVPVGAVIVYEGKIISTGMNRRETLKNSVHHAEIEAIYKACINLERWRLTGCTLYVTLEPCAMCSGAIINSRISRLVYASDDPKAGSCGSVINLFSLPYNHIPEITSGILKDDCSKILSSFFRKLRCKKDKNKKINL